LGCSPHRIPAVDLPYTCRVFPLRLQIVNTKSIKALEQAGRMAALKLGCDPQDGSQTAVMLGLSCERCDSSLGHEDNIGALVSRVHAQLLARWSPLRKCQPLTWEGQMVRLEDIGDAVATEGVHDEAVGGATR
jgi:hypothetical protein